MEYITKKDLIDCSTPDEFCFSLCCMECKTVWKSTPIRFSRAGKKPENENRKIIYDTLYEREKNLAFQKALNQAKEIFNICPICKRLVCDHCFLICDGAYYQYDSADWLWRLRKNRREEPVWLEDMQLLDDGSLLIMLTQERDDGSANELMFFRLTGF